MPTQRIADQQIPSLHALNVSEALDDSLRQLPREGLLSLHHQRFSVEEIIVANANACARRHRRIIEVIGTVRPFLKREGGAEG